MEIKEHKSDRIKHRKQVRSRLKSASKNAMKLKSVRYVLSGGIATGVDVFVFFVMINYVLQKTDLVFNHVQISAHVASLCVSFTLGLITNFLLTKYFVFSDSNIRGREQFVRYVLVATITFVGNYFMMKLLVEVFNIWPTFARLIAVGTIAILSFRLHKIFTFKIKLPQ
jgi:putative flippase GtrA